MGPFRSTIIYNRDRQTPLTALGTEEEPISWKITTFQKSRASFYG
jgi:hypothetical protein